MTPDRLVSPGPRHLPTQGGHTALIAACGCGETGCGSLSVQIRRNGGEVNWEPEPQAHYETVSRRYQFGLIPYLDAVDRAAGDPPAGEGRGRRVARQARVLLGLYEQKYQLNVFRGAALDWVSAWPWTTDVVRASVSTANGQRVLEFTPTFRESDPAFAARIAAELRHLQLTAS